MTTSQPHPNRTFPSPEASNQPNRRTGASSWPETNYPEKVSP